MKTPTTERRSCPVCFARFTTSSDSRFPYCSRSCADIAAANREERRSKRRPLPMRTGTSFLFGCALGFVVLGWTLRTNTAMAQGHVATEDAAPIVTPLPIALYPAAATLVAVGAVTWWRRRRDGRSGT